MPKIKELYPLMRKSKHQNPFKLPSKYAASLILEHHISFNEALNLTHERFFRYGRNNKKSLQPKSELERYLRKHLKELL